MQATQRDMAVTMAEAMDDPHYQGDPVPDSWEEPYEEPPQPSGLPQSLIHN